MDIGKHPAYDSIRPYSPGDIVTYGGDVWLCVLPVYPVVFGPARSAEAKEWRAKGDGVVHAPDSSDSHWKNISDMSEGDFAQKAKSSSSPTSSTLSSFASTRSSQQDDETRQFKMPLSQKILIGIGVAGAIGAVGFAGYALFGRSSRRRLR